MLLSSLYVTWDQTKVKKTKPKDVLAALKSGVRQA